jgi:hypothetical protein
MNIYEGKTVEWLLQRKSDLQDAIGGVAGGQTHVGISPGMYHEFIGLTEKQLRDRLREVMEALWIEDPDTYERPVKRNKIVTSYGIQDYNV